MQHYAQNANNSILCQISALHCETTTATALPTTPAANRFEMQRRCRSRALPIKRVAGRERTARREPRDSCVCALLFTRFDVGEHNFTLAQTSGSHHGIITGSLGPDRACCDLRPARCRGDHQSSDHRKVAATARVVAATEPAVVATAPSRDDAIVRHATTRRRDPCLVDTTRAARDDSRSVVTTSASRGPTRSRRDIAASRRRGTSRRDTTSVAATCRASPDPPPSPRPAAGRRDPRGSWRPGQVVATPASPRLKGSRDGDARVATTGLGSLRPASVAATRTMGRHDGAVGTTCDRSR